MELPGLAFAVWMLICFYASVGGYPNGKVREACTSMIPCHGSSPQLSPEHTITVNWTEFKPGDSIEGMSVTAEEFNWLFHCVACLYSVILDLSKQLNLAQVIHSTVIQYLFNSLLLVVEIFHSFSGECFSLIFLLVSVHLSGPVFEGFFIQARDAEHLESPALGSFMLADRRVSQLLTCGRTKVWFSVLKWDIRHWGVCTRPCAVFFELSDIQLMHSSVLLSHGGVWVVPFVLQGLSSVLCLICLSCANNCLIPSLLLGLVLWDTSSVLCTVIALSLHALTIKTMEHYLTIKKILVLSHHCSINAAGASL